MTERSRWGHAHRGHCLLLGNGRLALLVSPVAANGTRTKPLSIHRAECSFSIGTITERDETVATRPASLHVPHDAGLRDRAKGGEGLEKHLIIDLIGQIANEDVEVVRGILLRGVVGLVSPVDADFLYRSALTPIRSVTGPRCHLRCYGYGGRSGFACLARPHQGHRTRQSHS